MTDSRPAPAPAYEVRVLRSVRDELAKLPLSAQRQVLRRLRALAQDPRPPAATKLVGSDHWRIRIGDYRAIYEVRDSALIVLVIKVGHRRDVYRAK